MNVTTWGGTVFRTASGAATATLTLALLGASVLALTQPAAAQSRSAELLSRCQDEKAQPARRKSACEALVKDSSIETDMRAEALLNLGLAHEGAGEDQLAVQSYTEVIALDATSSVAHFNRANVLERLGQGQRALADYDKAIELDPADADYFYNRGLLLLEGGEAAKALADFERALTFGLNDGGIFAARAGALEKLGRKGEAVADYKKALQLEPGNSDAEEGLKRLQ